MTVCVVLEHHWDGTVMLNGVFTDEAAARRSYGDVAPPWEPVFHVVDVHPAEGT